MHRLPACVAFALCLVPTQQVFAGPMSYIASVEASASGPELNDSNNFALPISVSASVSRDTDPSGSSNATAAIANRNISLFAQAASNDLLDSYRAFARGDFEDHIDVDRPGGQIVFLIHVNGFAPPFGLGSADWSFYASSTASGQSSQWSENLVGAVNYNLQLVFNVADLSEGVDFRFSAFVSANTNATADFKNTFQLVGIQYLLPDGTPDPTAVITSPSGWNYAPGTLNGSTIPEPASLTVLGILVAGGGLYARRGTRKTA